MSSDLELGDDKKSEVAPIVQSILDESEKHGYTINGLDLTPKGGPRIIKSVTACGDILGVRVCITFPA
jgi:hypothetical protein